MSILLDALKKTQKNQQELTQAAAAQLAAENLPMPTPPPPEVAAAKEPARAKKKTPAATFKLSSLILPAVWVALGVALYFGLTSHPGKSGALTGTVAARNAQRRGQSQNNVSAYTTAEGQLPTVEGIVWDPDAPLAILAGRPVKVGDSADGWTVQSITPNQVNIVRDGIADTLTLPDMPVANK